jgi:hypothetical protein
MLYCVIPYVCDAITYQIIQEMRVTEGICIFSSFRIDLHISLNDIHIPIVHTVYS